MKLKIVLFANIICLSLHAQRDLTLVQDRNFWLTSGNAAALTTFSDSAIAYGFASYRYDGGNLRTLSEGRQQHSFSADVRSYSRLTADVVAFGSITYRNVSGTQMAGSMLFPTTELMPFDLVETTSDNAGGKRAETFNVTGTIGWAVWRNLSIGAKMDFTAGNYAKHKDLRHSNTLMNLDSRLNAYYALNDKDGIGAGFLYRRTTETLQFDTYGTTDAVYQTLVDYANNYGEIETYGGDGFTDGSQELPLFSEYAGVTAQAGWHGMFMDFSYRHRTGYYGRQSQYTVSHAQHSGDAFSWHLRYNLPQTAGSFCRIDLQLATERLTLQRTNYRKVSSSDNSSIVFYEYYEPTKMSDKAQMQGSIAFSGYWKPAGEIYLWHACGGMDYWRSKQTAYLYPQFYTATLHTLSPFVQARRSFLFADTSLLSVQTGYAMQSGSIGQVMAHICMEYEIPLRHTYVRPNVSVRYDLRAATAGNDSGLSRNSLLVSVGCWF